MNNLKFRRQFLFSAKECNELAHWNCENIDSHLLYIHFDCEFTKIEIADRKLYLIGYAINPYFPEKSSFQILEDISHFESIKDIPNLLYSLNGRFVLLVKLNKQYYFFNDACGLRQLFYTNYEGDLYAASQPLLLKLVINLKKSPNYDAYFKSRYVESNIEHWIPSGISLYEDVLQLVPNHYFDTSDYSQKRFWPNYHKAEISLEESVGKISFLLKNTMLAANKRYKLALSLTSGKDSRIILSSCKEIIDNIYAYTLQYRDLTEHSHDIKIPDNLSKRFGFNHHIINCNNHLETEFEDIYKQNSDLAHLDDWGKIAYALYKNFPQDRIAIKGNCVEIGRCVYYKLGKHKKITSGKNFSVIYSGYDIDFIKERISEWYEEVKNIEEHFGFDLFDLFYWEHRLGSWQAQSQLEWDIVQEVITPFNNRELINYMLAVDSKYRIGPKFQFFNELITYMWEDLNLEPIDPASQLKRLRTKIKSILIYYNIRPNLFNML